MTHDFHQPRAYTEVSEVAMKLSGLHILLTYQCTFECDHCFVWGSPRQHGVLTLEQVDEILDQAKEAGVESIYFEGDEPRSIVARWVLAACTAICRTGSAGSTFCPAA